jgi:Bacterial Ig-like domain (group 3)
MRFKLSLCVASGVLACTASLGVVSAPVAQAAASAVALPITQYSHMLVDPGHHHLFFTSGSGSSSILVTDYSGQIVAIIPNEPDATGLALSSDGSTVYAALPGANAISAISTSTLTETARYLTGAGTGPSYVAYTSGMVWFGYDGSSAGDGQIGSINPSTSPATVTLDASPGDYWYAAPMLTASAGGELVAGETGESPPEFASFDVSSGTATVLAPQERLENDAILQSFQITPDGQDVVIASGYPYYQQIYQVSDLAAVGSYPTTNYPNSVSISDDGYVAAGTSSGTNAIFMFAPGGSTPVNTYDFGSNWLAADGAALTPDGTELFAVTLAGGPTGAPTLNIIPNPEQPEPHPTSTEVTCSPSTAVIGQATSCTATVTDPATSGSTTPTGTVTFTSDTSDGILSGGGSCTLSPTSTSGQASCSVSYTPGQVGSGTHTITASYGGDGSHVASSGQVTVSVTLRATATALSCSKVLPVRYKCTVTVSDTSPGTATTPTGVVSLTSSGRGVFSATQCTLSGSGTSATCRVYYAKPPGVPFGGQTITASYGGDNVHQNSSGSTTLP